MNRLFLEILAIFLLIIINGFFSLSEFSIIASRRSRLKRMVKEGSRAAGRAVKIHARPESFLATVQVGITFVGIMTGVFGGVTLVNYLYPLIAQIDVEIVRSSARAIASVLVAASITFFSVIIGELVPKYIALARPERIAATVSAPITVFIKVSFFLVKILTGAARLFIRLIGIKKLPERGFHTEEEIIMLVTEGTEKGIFDPTEKDLIHSVFEFTDTTARQAMTPRTDITGIGIDYDTERIINIITEYGYSRFPVFEESMDNIVGILYTKDIIDSLHSFRSIVINDIIRKPFFVPDSMKLNILLRTFQQKRIHAAIVLDEFGGTAGLITLRDLLEEIVGEIKDEFDSGQKEFVRKSANVAFASGTLQVSDLNDQFNINLPEDEADTVGGLIFERLGHPGAKGEEITIEDTHFKILEVEGNRINRIRIKKSRGAPPTPR